MTLKESVQQFVEYSVRVRELSTPQLHNIKDAEEYREKLLDHFVQIGEIAKRNEEILNGQIMPLLNSTRPLTEEEVQALLFLKEQFLDAYQMDSLDIPVLFLVTQRLVAEAEHKQDVSDLIPALDDFVMASYTLYVMTRRLLPVCTYATACRSNALLAIGQILHYLPLEHFRTLPGDHLKEIVLINARYIIAFHESLLRRLDAAARAEIITLMERALSLTDDAFYRKEAAFYDWTYHEFRTLQYLATLTSFYNASGYDAAQLKKFNGYSVRLWDAFLKNRESAGIPDSEEAIRLDVLRNACLAGEMSVPAFRREILKLTGHQMTDKPEYDEIILATSVLLEYASTLDTQNLTKEQQKNITRLYRNLVRYVHRIPKHGTFTFLLTELALVLDNFIEIDGGIDFETMCLELLAAVHPPTYIHSLSVADLTVCLVENLYRLHPELFKTVPGYPDIGKIKDFSWHAAACHDFGKLLIVETIITYGRKLYDFEFEWIRSHPSAGAAILEKHGSTRPYANVARGHHRWYNDTRGYPESFSPSDVPERLIVDLVMCADCLDAATDGVGRSYKRGITLDEFASELREGSGTQYNPVLPALFEDNAVRDALNEILYKGRNEKYFKTYQTLLRVME